MHKSDPSGRVIELSSITSLYDLVFVSLSFTHKKTPALYSNGGLLKMMPDNDLLSHGETPHYHRR